MQVGLTLLIALHWYLVYDHKTFIVECCYAEGEDFVSLNFTLVWHFDSPSLTQCVSVAIINDECVEEKEEVFTVSLSSEEECVDIGPNYCHHTGQ